MDLTTGSPGATERKYTFGPFQLHASERRLSRDGSAIEIGSRALDILIALVERAGEVVGKKELIRRVWPEVIVEESSLRVHVVAIRKALGDGIEGARYIANVPGRGYSFVATVSAAASVLAQPAAIEREQARAAASLPARLTRMVGREAAIRSISERLRAARFVTIVGPGGLGKTTVAVSVAHLLQPEFSAAVFVDLAAVTDAGGVPNALAATLGLTTRQEDPTPEILAFLREIDLLLVLDNCEHVVDAIGRLAERIFVEAPRVHILATSRELLNVEGEHVYMLEPLRTPETTIDITAEHALEYAAVQLFLERAGAAAGPIALSDECAPVVASIVHRLDGIALAIELAAARVGVFGIRGIAELLDKQLPLAWRGRRTAQPRHQTLSATLDWSYGLLSDEEKAALCRLSAFMGEFTLAAALAVAVEPDDDASNAIEGIASLVAKSLISMRVTEGQPRYRLLGIVRAYASVRLDEWSEAKLIAARHARYFSLRCRETIDGIAAGRALDSRDLGDIRSALEWSFSEAGDASIARDLSMAAAPVLLRWSLLAECRVWSSRALETLQDADRDSIHESQLLRTLAISTTFTLGNDERVRTYIERGLTLARKLGDQRAQFEFLTGQHVFHGRIGDFLAARDAAVEAEKVASEEEIASAQWMQGMALHLAGDQTQALARCDAALSRPAVSTASRKRYFGYDQRTPGLGVRARVLWLKGQTEQALEGAAQAVAEGARLDHPVSCCLTLLNTASVYLWSERWNDAEQAIQRLVDTSRRYSLDPYFASGSMLKGELQHALGDHEGAVALLSDAARRLNRERQVAQAPYCSAILADALRASGQLAPALDVIDRAIAQRESAGTSYDLPEMHRIKALIFLASGKRAAAVNCLERGVALARAAGTASWEKRLHHVLATLPAA